MTIMERKENKNKLEVPIHLKQNLTLEEAAAYSNIGVCALRNLTNDPKCEFVLFVGSKRLIKRRLFEKYIDECYSI